MNKQKKSTTAITTKTLIYNKVRIKYDPYLVDLHKMSDIIKFTEDIT